MPAHDRPLPPPTARLSNKLTVMLFTALLATLALSGGAFWWMLDSFHEAQAQSKITDALHALRYELIKSGNLLDDTAKRLSAQPDVVSSVNLIHSYEDPKHYQPLVFDEEKRKLAAQFHQSALNGGFDVIAAYTPDGRISAFALRQKGRVSPGYVTYTAKGEQQFVLASETDPQSPMLAFVPPSFLSLPEEDLAARAGRTFTHGVSGGLMMDFIAPIQRVRPTGEPHNLGWLRTLRILDLSVFSTLGGRAGVNVTLHPAPHPIDQPTDVSETLTADFGPDIPALSLTNGATPQFARHTGAEHFSGAAALPDSHGGASVFVLSIAKSELLAGLKAFRDASLAVLVLATLLFLPAMLLFMRANITRPLNELVDSALRLKTGERFTPAGVARVDEIGQLAQAFDAMALTVQARESELREKQALLDGLVDNAPSLIQVRDAENRYVLVNTLWESFFGKTLGQVRGKTPEEVLPPASAAQASAHFEQIRKMRAAQVFEEELEGVKATRLFASTRFPLFDADGEVYAVCGITQDITERKQAEERLRLTQRVVDETAEGIMITDPATRIIDVNPAFSTITGFPRDEVLGHTPKIMSSGRHDHLFYHDMWSELARTGQWSGEIWNRRKNGEVYPQWMTISTIYDERGEVLHYVGVFSDISRAKETERQLDHLAHYDALTELPNRVLFQDRLRRAVARHRRHGLTGALMFIDLDRFKQVNDSLGHEMGDLLLVEATERLLECIREEDTVARLGGDEFTVVLNELDEETRAQDVAQRIIKSMEEPFMLGDNEVFISASVGIVLFPDDGDTLEELTRNADLAMYEAKSKGRATFQFFNAGMNARVHDRMVLEAGLRAASLNDELRLFFQPKYDLAVGRITGVEALVRWLHPERGLLTPDKFISLAEETGLILDIGRWVIREACRQARQWETEHGHTLSVAVNLSARQFADAKLADDIAEALQQGGLDAKRLTIEVTESMVMDDVEHAVGVLNRLKRLGLSISIDDFGTGYSSLSQLRRLPVDELKIDRTFVSDIPKSTEDMEIVSAVISMAKSLHLKVVAEGVETLEQMEFLRAHDCHVAQGYLIGKPAEGKVVPLYLDDNGPNAEIFANFGPSGRTGRTLQ